MRQWKNLKATLERFVETETVVGCGMQVCKEDQMIFNEQRGAATADGELPLTEHSMLRMHSMSKTMTCAGFMTLYDQGLFALDDPVAEYLPEFDNPVVCVSETNIQDVVPANQPITIRHLLSMRSGIPYWTFPGMPDEGPVQKALRDMASDTAKDVKQGKSNTLEALVKKIAEMPLCFHPGEHWLYGLSLTVIGRLIEVFSGMSIGDYLKKALWGPLEMTRTSFVQQVSDKSKISDLMVEEVMCSFVDGELLKGAVKKGKYYGVREDVLPGTDLGVQLPCGGMISSLHDLGRLFRMFANGGVLNGQRILARHTIDLMRSNQLEQSQLNEFAQETNRGFGYGLGYRTMLDPSVAGFYMPKGSFGWDGASGCYGLAYPEENLAIVFAESSLPHHIIYTIPRVVAAMNADLDAE